MNKRKLLVHNNGNNNYKHNDHNVKLSVRHRFFVHNPLLLLKVWVLLEDLGYLEVLVL
jgi:hypothetical protein